MLENKLQQYEEFKDEQNEIIDKLSDRLLNTKSTKSGMTIFDVSIFRGYFNSLQSYVRMLPLEPIWYLKVFVHLLMGFSQPSMLLRNMVKGKAEKHETSDEVMENDER